MENESGAVTKSLWHSGDVVKFYRCGGTENLKLELSGVSQLKPNEVLLRVESIGLNQADLLYLKGEHTTETVLPSRIGSEATGVVIEYGSKVTGLAVGQQVSSIPFQTSEYGVLGEFAVVPSDYITPAFPTLSSCENSAVWMQYMTAYFPFCELSNLSRGDTVLITAAASSAGIGAVQLAKYLGYKVVATTRSEEKIEFLRSLGAEAVVLSQGQNFEKVMLDISKGQGVKLAYDCVGGKMINNYVLGMAKGSQLFHYGALGP